MNYRWIGAILIIAGCSSFGFSMAAKQKRLEKMLRQFIHALQFMENELSYHLTPLPELCRQTAKELSGTLREVFLNLARELDWQISPDVSSCMDSAIQRSHDLPISLRKHMNSLGQDLGRFDLPGQLRGLQSIRASCKEDLKNLNHNSDIRLRSYRTVGICAGIALAILLA